MIVTDDVLIAIICNGWLSNKYAAEVKEKDTARKAYEIAKEILRLMREDEGAS